jgi:hypothetical protein
LSTAKRYRGVLKEDRLSNATGASKNDELVVYLASGNIVKEIRAISQVEGLSRNERAIGRRPGNWVSRAHNRLPPRVVLAKSSANFIVTHGWILA